MSVGSTCRPCVRTDVVAVRERFAQRCYALLLQVPSGRVTTYREIAHALGTRAYRAVGNAMHRNPYAPRIPCHRVVASDGTLGGFAFGSGEKRRRLAAEGVDVIDGHIAHFTRVLFTFPKQSDGTIGNNRDIRKFEISH